MKNQFDLGKMLNDTTLSGISKERKLKRVPLDQIAPSSNNKYPIEDVEELAYLIEEFGLIHPISLLRIGKEKYKISSGERRYQAYIYLKREDIEAVIENDVEDVDEERIRLIVGNTARHKTPEVIQMEVVELSELYDHQKAKGKIQKGVLKRDWIAQLLGYRDGRSVQPYLSNNKGDDRPKFLKTELPLGIKELKKLQNILNKTLPIIEDILSDCEPEIRDSLLRTIDNLSGALRSTYEENK